jgi:hypothetical protein
VPAVVLACSTSTHTCRVRLKQRKHLSCFHFLRLLASFYPSTAGEIAAPGEAGEDDEDYDDVSDGDDLPHDFESSFVDLA